MGFIRLDVGRSLYAKMFCSYVVELCLNECLLNSFCEKVNGKSEQEVFS